MNTFTLINKVEVRDCMSCPYVNEPAKVCNITGAKLDFPHWVPDDCPIKGCTIDCT